MSEKKCRCCNCAICLQTTESTRKLIAMCPSPSNCRIFVLCIQLIGTTYCRPSALKSRWEKRKAAEKSKLQRSWIQHPNPISWFRNVIHTSQLPMLVLMHLTARIARTFLCAAEVWIPANFRQDQPWQQHKETSVQILHAQTSQGLWKVFFQLQNKKSK